MATVNTIKTRILNKYDLLANYNNFTPLRGEICLCVVGESATTNKGLNGDTTKKPIVGIKVGDGTTAFNDLPWIQAVAGDVSTYVKGITNEAKFKELVNAIIAEADLASADTLAGVDGRLQTAEGKITNLENAVNTGDNSLANLRSAINGVLGTASDASSANTVYGAKKYAEEQAAAAKSGAESTAASTYEKKGVAAGLVSTLETGKVKDNADAISGINTKIGSTAYTGDSMTAAIASLQSAVGTGAEGLGSKVEALETAVGDASSGLVKDVADLKTADTNMGTRVDGIEDRVEANEGKLAGITGTVSAAISAVDAKAEQNKTDISGVSGKVTTLIGSDANKSVRTIANEELAAQLLSGSADADFTTLQELAAWLEGHPEDVAAINASITSMKSNLGYTTVNGAEVVPDPVNTRITNATKDLASKSSVEANTTSINGAIDRIEALEEANGTNGATTQAIATAKQEAINTVVGKNTDAKTANTVYGAKAFATDVAASKASAAQTAAVSAAKSETTTQVTALANGQVKTNTDAIADINTKIGNLDGTFADTNAGVVTALTQTDGKVSVTQRKVKAADLDESDVFVLYCGEAAGYSLTSVQI